MYNLKSHQQKHCRVAVDNKWGAQSSRAPRLLVTVGCSIASMCFYTLISHRLGGQTLQIATHERTFFDCSTPAHCTHAQSHARSARLSDANLEFSTNLHFVNFDYIQHGNLAEICIQMLYLRYRANRYQQYPVNKTFLSHTVSEIHRSQDLQFLRKLDKIDRGQLQRLTPPLDMKLRESVGASECRAWIEALNCEI
jgi:hypothetical protein